MFNSPVQTPVPIVGGTPVLAYGHFDFQVVLLIAGALHCGGFILNIKFAGTAAHCVRNLKPEQCSVGFGSTDLTKSLTSPVECLYHHEDFSLVTGDMDVGVIKIKGKFAGDHVAPIPFARTRLPAGTDVTVSGWGDTKNPLSKRSKILNYAVLHLINVSDCIALYGKGKDLLSNNMICAKDTMGAACSGDSGGPLSHNGTLYGIVSWGDKSCRYYPSVFTDVTSKRVIEFFGRFISITYSK